MNDDDLRPCPFCGENFTTTALEWGWVQLEHPKNNCLLAVVTKYAMVWTDRALLVDTVNARPIENELRGLLNSCLADQTALELVIQRHEREIFRLKSCNRALKRINEVRKSGRWWMFWRKNHGSAS